MTVTAPHPQPPGQADLERAFALQRDYRWTAKTSSAEHRIALLRKLREAVLRNADATRDALFQDLRKPAEQPMMDEVAVVLYDIDHAVEHLAQWMRPVPVEPRSGSRGDTARVVIQYEARGVVLLFGAWNFPFQLVLAPLVPVLAAGNTAIVKPNEMAPATSALVATILREVFDEQQVAVFEGGVDLANQLLELPVDHIFFTGSPAVGKLVMAAAAGHLASVTLELGGKCPAIIDGTTDLDVAVAYVAAGKTYNAGQVCLSPDYVLIRRDLRDAFVDRYLRWIDTHLYSDGTFNSSAMSAMVDVRNQARVMSYVDEAVQKGATLRGRRGADEDARSIEPVVLLDVPSDASVLREEIFGPVLPVLTWDDTAGLTEHVRAGDKPLAIYIYSSDQNFVSEVLAGTSSGGVTVNGWADHFREPNAPFGGVGSSGMGSYHGVHGFLELSHARTVFVNT